jgi:hypothetical protein
MVAKASPHFRSLQQRSKKMKIWIVEDRDMNYRYVFSSKAGAIKYVEQVKCEGKVEEFRKEIISNNYIEYFDYDSEEVIGDWIIQSYKVNKF